MLITFRFFGKILKSSTSFILLTKLVKGYDAWPELEYGQLGIHPAALSLALWAAPIDSASTSNREKTFPM